MVWLTSFYSIVQISLSQVQSQSHQSHTQTLSAQISLSICPSRLFLCLCSGVCFHLSLNLSSSLWWSPNEYKTFLCRSFSLTASTSSLSLLSFCLSCLIFASSDDIGGGFGGPRLSGKANFLFFHSCVCTVGRQQPLFGCDTQYSMWLRLGPCRSGCRGFVCMPFVFFTS